MITLFGVEDSVLGLEECDNSHTLTTTTTQSKNSQKEVKNQIDKQNQCSVPPESSLLYRFLVLIEVKYKTRTQQQNSAETVAHDLSNYQKMMHSTLSRLLAVALRMHIQMTYYCLNNQCEY